MNKLLESQRKALEDIALLVLRLFMGATFLAYGVKKITSFDNYVILFSDKLDLPFPLLNLYIVIAVEVIGGLFILVGFLTRATTIPLIITMITALFLVNINNGFAASKFGMEIPLAYIAILLVLFAFGEGKYGIDKTEYELKKA